MTTKQKEICNIIETLPDELSSKVLDYIEYLKYTVATATAPKELIAQDKKDLKEKLEEGIKDSESGNVYSIDEVFDEVEKIKYEVQMQEKYEIELSGKAKEDLKKIVTYIKKNLNEPTIAKNMHN